MEEVAGGEVEFETHARGVSGLIFVSQHAVGTEAGKEAKEQLKHIFRVRGLLCMVYARTTSNVSL